MAIENPNIEVAGEVGENKGGANGEEYRVISERIGMKLYMDIQTALVRKHYGGRKEFDRESNFDDWVKNYSSAFRTAICSLAEEYNVNELFLKDKDGLLRMLEAKVADIEKGTATTNEKTNEKTGEETFKRAA